MSSNSVANKRIARNSIFMSIRMVVVLFLTLYTTRIVLNALGVVDYGVYNAVCGFVSMFSFLSTSMSNGIQRFYNFELGRHGIEGAKRVFNTGLLIQLIISIIIIILIESFGLWYLTNKMVIPEDRYLAAHLIFQFSMASFLFNVIQAPFSAAIMAHEKMDFYAIVSIIDAILKLFIAFVVTICDSDHLILYVLLYSLISVFNFMTYWLYSKSEFEEISICFGIDQEMLQSMIGFSGWNFFGTFAGMMKEQGINLILNLFCGPVVNAARGVASQVNGGLQSFVQNITIPVRPQVVQSYASGDYERTMMLTFMISKMSCLLLYLLALPICYEINYILYLWLGNSIPDHTDTFVVIIILTTFITNLNSAVSGVIHASGKMGKYQIVTSIITLFSLPVAFISLNFGSSPEMALVIVFIFILLSQIAALQILKTIVNYSITEYIKNVIYPLLRVIALTCWIPIILQKNIPESFIRLCVISIFCFVIVSVTSYYFVLSKSEKNYFKKFVSRISNRYKN